MELLTGPGTSWPCLQIQVTFSNAFVGGINIGTVYYNVGLVVLDSKQCYCPRCLEWSRRAGRSTVQAGVNHCRKHQHETDRPRYFGFCCWVGEHSTWCCACARFLTADKGGVEQHACRAQHTANAIGWRECADEKINSKKKVLFSFFALRFSVCSPCPLVLGSRSSAWGTARQKATIGNVWKEQGYSIGSLACSVLVRHAPNGGHTTHDS